MGAMIRAKFCSIKDMDAHSFFFYLENKKTIKQKQMYHLWHANGTIHSDPVEIRKIAVDFLCNII